MEKTQPVDFQQLDREIGRLIHTDFNQAKIMLALLAEAIGSDSTGAQRAVFQLHSAHFANQIYQFHDAATHFEQAIALLETGNKSRQAAEARLDLAAVFTNLREWEKAENCLELARLFLKKTPDDRLLARLVFREGYLRLYEGNSEKAVAQLLDAERLMSKNGEPSEPADLVFLTGLHSGLGEIFEKSGDFERAAEARLRALEIAEKNGLRSRISWLYLNAGRALESLGDAERAAHFYDKAISTEDDVSRDARAHACGNLGKLLAIGGATELGHQLFRRAVKLYGKPRTRDDFNNLCLVTGWSAQIFLTENRFAEADEHFLKALEFGKQGDQFWQVADFCRTAAQFQAERGEFERAFFFQKQADEFSTRHFSAKTEEKIREISTRYEAENRRREAELARLEATGLQLRALRAQMNPHFVFNALNAIQGLLTSARLKEANDWLIAFSKLFRRALDLSNQETIRLEDEIEFLRNYLEINQKLRFGDQFSFIIEAGDELETDLLFLPTMMIQPYVENAIEHGIKPRQGGSVRIVFFENEAEKILECHIEDDGFGIREMTRQAAANPENRRHRSRGREITEERLRLLHRAAGRRVGEWVKTIDIGEETGGKRHGTRVEMRIPLLNF